MVGFSKVLVDDQVAGGMVGDGCGGNAAKGEEAVVAQQGFASGETVSTSQFRAMRILKRVVCRRDLAIILSLHARGHCPTMHLGSRSSFWGQAHGSGKSEGANDDNG